MRKNCFFVHVLLTAVTGAVCLIALVFQTVRPEAALLRPSIPLLAALSLTALALESYLAPQAHRSFAARLLGALWAAALFFLLPWAAGLLPYALLWRSALWGGVTFLISDWLFAAIRDRLSYGPPAKAAPALSALLLYLAAQGLQGLF